MIYEVRLRVSAYHRNEVRRQLQTPGLCVTENKGLLASTFAVTTSCRELHRMLHDWFGELPGTVSTV